MKLFCQWYVLIYFLWELCSLYAADPKDVTARQKHAAKLLGTVLIFGLGYSLYTAGAWSLLLL